MSIVEIICARCTVANHAATRFCERCGLPLGSAQPDADAGADALGPYEPLGPEDADSPRLVRALVSRSGYPASPSGHGWRLDVPLHLDRRQAVYVGHAGTDAEGRLILSLVSVCGPANQRDARILLKFNARAMEGHFAIKVLRGEEYFVVIENLSQETAEKVDAGGLVRRIAQVADGLEERLSRGMDLY